MAQYNAEVPKTGLIYIITNDLNDKVYVGQTIKTLQNRLTKHSNDINIPKDGINYAVKKYGLKHFTITLLEKCLRTELDEKERYWIAYCNSYYPNGYNLTQGGQASLSAKLSDLQCSECINLYLQGKTVKEICSLYNIETSTLYSVLNTSETLLRQNRTEAGRAAAINNFKKATEARQISIYNVTLDIKYNSKKDALVDMIEKGFSKAVDWHNIRSPLDRALKGYQDTAFGFEWEVCDE